MAADGTETGDSPIPVSVQDRAGRPLGLGHLIRFLHLVQDLRFSEHHRIEAGSHPEGMAHGLVLHMVVEFILEDVEGGLGPRRQQLRDCRLGLVGVRGNRIDLHAVAGRQHQPLEDRGFLPQALEHRRELRLRDVQPLPNLDRRRRVIEPMAQLPRWGRPTRTLTPTNVTSSAQKLTTAKSAAFRPRHPPVSRACNSPA